MALELITNNAQTTVSGSIDGVTDPVTFTVASSAAFPSSGNFRVLIGSEILKVTSVSGSDFTASRAQEGTSIAAHSNGDAVTLILTAASLRKIVAEYHLKDAIASRPAAGTEGRLFFPSGGGPVFRDTGSAWEIWVHGMGPFTPPTADFTTWVNQGSATVATTNGYLQLEYPGVEATTEDLHMRVKALPSTTFTMTLVFHLNEPPGQNGNYGIVVRDSGSSKIMAHSVRPVGPTVSGYTWSGSSASFNSSLFADAYNRGTQGPLFFLRLRGDGTTYFFDNSVNGVDWTNNRQVTIATAYVSTPNQVGFYMLANNARSNQTCGMSVYHAVLS